MHPRSPDVLLATLGRLTPNQFEYIRIVQQHPEGITGSDIAKETGFSAGSIYNYGKRFQDLGLTSIMAGQPMYEGMKAPNIYMPRETLSAELINKATKARSREGQEKRKAKSQSRTSLDVENQVILDIVTELENATVNEISQALQERGIYLTTPRVRARAVKLRTLGALRCLPKTRKNSKIYEIALKTSDSGKDLVETQALKTTLVKLELEEKELEQSLETTRNQILVMRQIIEKMS